MGGKKKRFVWFRKEKTGRHMIMIFPPIKKLVAVQTMMN